MTKHTLLAAIALGLCLAGCAVGPDFRRPVSVAPEHFARGPSDEPSRDATRASDDAFWRRFGDPQLNALIERGLANNYDLAVEVARYDSANALLRNAKFDRYPAITAQGNAGVQQVSRDQSYGFPRNFRTYGLDVTASWELDLFGRVRRSVEAQRAETAATAADVSALQVVIASKIANAYIELRGLQERRRVAQEQVNDLDTMLRVVEARQHAGRADGFDIVRARAQLELTQSGLPALEAGIAFHEHRLAVLTGQVPGALIGELHASGTVPMPPASIDPGTPADLLRRRPDVAAAEARLHAATARIGVATADLFPRVRLLGGVGTQAYHHADLFDSASQTGLIALGIDWSFLDVGRVRARLASSEADAAGLLAQYQQAVLHALEDTENALVNYDRTSEEHLRLEAAARDSAEAERIARIRYESGAIDLYELLDAQRQTLSAQDAEAEGRARRSTAAIALYEALAGGWPQRLTPPPTISAPEPARTGTDTVAARDALE